MGCKNLEYFEFFNFSKSTLKIIIIYSILEHHLKKNKNGDLNSSKHSKFLHSIRFSYKKFNEDDKLKFGDDLIYFLS
jgi:hypothetical protein